MAYATEPWHYPTRALYVDGVWGNATYGATQTYLKRKGFYPADYLIDGVYGHGTRTAIQKYLAWRGLYHGEIDGIMGSMSTRAWADYLSYDGNPYGVAYYAYSYYPASDTSASLGRSWQKYLNDRRW